MKRGMGFVAAVFIFGLVTMGGQGCQGSKSANGASNSASSSGGGNAGLAAFQSGLYAFVRAQNCTMCHGNSTGPLFAVSNVSQAYAAAKTVIDFNNPDSSDFVAYVSNNHCGQTLCSNTANTATIKTLLEQWATAELNPTTGGGNSTPTSVKYTTTSVALPATVPTLMSSATPAVMRFQLSALSPAMAALSKAIAEIEIQKVSTGEYRINRIKIAGNTAAVKVTGVHIYVKASGTNGIGSENSGTGANWTDLVATAATSTVPANLPTGPMTTVQPLATDALVIDANATDMITLGFDDLQ